MAREDVRRRLPAYSKRLYGYALALTGAEDEAHELARQAAARALAAPGAPAEEPGFRVWLFGIVRTLAGGAAGRRFGEAAKPEDAPDVRLSGPDDSRIDPLTVRQAMGALDGEGREVLALVDVAGFSYAEAGQLLGLSADAVLRRVSRARKALIAALDQSPVRRLRARRDR